MSPPNVLLITSDQQHWNTLSCLGAEVETPHLDRLAARGTCFERAYCPNPTCTPTRASIITGQWPSQHGAYSLGTKLMEGVHTVGEDFLAAGYRTSLVGKAHFQPLQGTEEFPSIEAYPTLQDLDFWRKFDRRFYGFEHVELARNHADEAHVGQHYALWMEEKGCADWRRYFRPPTGTRESRDRVWEIPEELHYNTWISERTNALLDGYAERGEPFFAWASFFDPHPPYLIPEPWASMYDPSEVTVPQVTPGEHERNPRHFRLTQERDPDWSEYRIPGGYGIHGAGSHLVDRDELAKDIAVYYGMIACLDEHVGRILDRLEATGLAEDTIVVFTTDHGHFFGQHGLKAKGPYHFEDQIRVPMLVSWPGHVPAGRHSQALQTLVDLAPTWLDCCGLEIPRSMTGISQRATWEGDDGAARDAVLCENHHQPERIYAKSYVESRHKLTVYAHRDEGELFDLEEDPGEVRNLWNSPDHRDLKLALMHRFLQAEFLKEPLPMPRVFGA